MIPLFLFWGLNGYHAHKITHVHDSILPVLLFPTLQLLSQRLSESLLSETCKLAVGNTHRCTL